MLHLQDGDEIRNVAVEIFMPVNDDDDRGPAWKCEFCITGLSRVIDRAAYGVDPVQALMLALKTVGVELNFSEERKANLLFWSEPNDDLGFPVTKNVSEDLTERADLELAKRGLAPSRARARAEIEAGTVFCDGELVTKPSTPIAAGSVLEIRGAENPWVSRGGLKLDYALERFKIDVTGAVALDLGASTGGFTDVLLAKGAARVYAIDVGHDQLHEKLRGDARVISHEGVNARELDATVIPEPVDLIVADLSFISLKIALSGALALARPDAMLVVLVKPQFEAGKAAVKKGVVRDPEVHERVCNDIAAWIGMQGWRVLGTVPSPIEGPEGNREFLLAARREP
jgi:23S rRNA (cytidine1920-2'-O)/16S rRNA (cytidine1409-2'-O)-methyltransferase